MDRRERLGSLEQAVLAAIQGHQAGVWTALPGIIKSYDAAKMTVEVNVSIKMQFQLPDGSWEDVAIKPLVDCPILFPGGGGFTLTFPVEPGDECLVMFSSRCIDSWWQSGGVQVQADFRMHDLSDGFAFIGPRSQPRVLSPAGSTSGVELRNDARTAYVRIDDADSVTVVTPANLTASVGGTASVSAPTINLTGNVNVVGNLVVTGTLTNNAKNVGSTHTHGGVQTGSGTTGAPT